ncbi:MAG TPA: twin-arginine translocase TatA/TatE family subunit [Actinomycetota bacterium]|nr:twin-arginine translocase TatA/TatE family subunit [Actinomycetota bacterium]
MTRTADEMLNIGPQELLIILVIALLVVGPKRLPELGRSIGRGLRELRKAQDEVRRTLQVNLDEPDLDGGTRANTRPDADTGSSSGPARSTGVQDPTPTAGDTPTADEVREISRSLGRSLGQLRKAREEVQRSFRVDLDAPAPTRPAPASPPSTANGDGSAASETGPAPDDPARG